MGIFQLSRLPAAFTLIRGVVGDGDEALVGELAA